MKKKKESSENNVALYFFHQGNDTRAYDYFGSHPLGNDGSFVFRVWAEHAAAVSVVGDFNGWNPKANPLSKIDEGGVFEGFAENVKAFDAYKYCIITRDGREILKSDPFALHMETRPGTASKIYIQDDYDWNDQLWLKKRRDTPVYSRPVNINEVHAGSWRTYEDGNPFSYRALADELVPYVKSMGYTH
ncbi:MAG: 1,4-alpha-glucan branching enzyme, partial [Clostridiales bacterium]|nr:1,4-alpha-glucan branching enzyme [Clostridiales bacterium]